MPQFEFKELSFADVALNALLKEARRMNRIGPRCYPVTWLEYRRDGRRWETPNPLALGVRIMPGEWYCDVIMPLDLYNRYTNTTHKITNVRAYQQTTHGHLPLILMPDPLLRQVIEELYQQ